MAEQLIGSLIYGEHAIPKKRRPWKDLLKVPLAIGLVLLIIGGLIYKFANYREERAVAQFLEEVRIGQYDSAYAVWDVSEGHYPMMKFLEDWGASGYYTTGMHKAGVIDSNSKGPAVVVYVEIDSFKNPVALRVNKETHKLSFSPINKYKP